jgi:hypothetical protein
MATVVRKRTAAAGIAMVAGGLLLATPVLFGPANATDDMGQRLENIATDPGPYALKNLCFQLAALLLLPGVVAMVGRVRGRGTSAVVSGGVVFAAGLVGLFGFVVIEASWVSLSGEAPIDPAVVAAAERLNEGSGIELMAPGLLAILCFHLIGLPWFSFGLVRARAIPWWLALVASLGMMFAFFGSGTSMENVGWLVCGLALAAIGVTVVRPEIKALGQRPTPESAEPAAIAAPA